MPGTGASDPVAQVRGLPPFDGLPEPLFAEAAAALEVGRAGAGERLVTAGGEPLRHLYVVLGGAVRLVRDGRTLQVLEEGETFGYTSLLSRHATLDVVVEEELRYARLPAAIFDRLLSDAGFAAHFAAGLSGRLRASLERSGLQSFRADLSAPVGSLLRRGPVWAPPGATVAEAARLMRREGVSSVLVPGDPPAIATDRDLRNRVLAEGRGPQTPLDAIASRPLQTIPAELSLTDAWLALLDAGIHHLPVVKDGAVAGLLTSTDLLRSAAQGPVAVLRGVERLPSRQSLPGYGRRLAEMCASLLAGGLEPTAIAGLVARLNDALLRPILRWAEADLGPPPAPYAWMVFGSEGRMEQTLLTDQDNALVYADEGAAQAEWYRRLAELVNADLAAAGFPPCPGGYMARAWHGTLSSWRERFRGWIEVPTPQALLVAAIFFDFRRVGGALDLGPLGEVVTGAAERPAFLRLLAELALHFRPPAELALRLRGGAAELDLKRHGLAPIVFLARCQALELGSPARSTEERLAAARRAGRLTEDTEQAVADAYRFLLGLRLRQQLAALAAGQPPHDDLRLADLPAVDRGRLRAAFRAIRAWQEEAAFHFNVTG